jgi:hypothetical protein
MGDHQLLNPENVDYESPLPCPEPKPYVFPKKVTEDDMRNEVRFVSYYCQTLCKSSFKF